MQIQAIETWHNVGCFLYAQTLHTSVDVVCAAGGGLWGCPGSCFHQCRPEKPECRPERQTPINHPERSSWTGGRSASQSRNRELQPGEAIMELLDNTTWAADVVSTTKLLMQNWNVKLKLHRSKENHDVYLNGHFCQEDRSENIVGHTQKHSLLKKRVRLIETKYINAKKRQFWGLGILCSQRYVLFEWSKYKLLLYTISLLFLERNVLWLTFSLHVARLVSLLCLLWYISQVNIQEF